MSTLREGDLAPDFALPDQDGRTVCLSEVLADGPVVLFFYPMAHTPGCTAEACHFRDLDAEFAAAGALRLGISKDSVERQRSFADRHGFGFPLLSDPDGATASAYGVRRGGLLGAVAATKRVTFVIGSDRRIRRVIASELDMSAHADRALQSLRS